VVHPLISIVIGSDGILVAVLEDEWQKGITSRPGCAQGIKIRLALYTIFIYNNCIHVKSLAISRA